MATKKTTSKSTAASKASAAEKGADATEADTTATADARVKNPALKIRDLVQRVAEATGSKKKQDVKEIVEATLVALGDALTKGEDLNLPGFGRTRIARTAEKDGASMMTLKVRRGAHKKKDDKEPLADDEDDG